MIDSWTIHLCFQNWQWIFFCEAYHQTINPCQLCNIKFSFLTSVYVMCVTKTDVSSYHNLNLMWSCIVSICIEDLRWCFDYIVLSIAPGLGILGIYKSVWVYCHVSTVLTLVFHSISALVWILCTSHKSNLLVCCVYAVCICSVLYSYLILIH